MITKIHGESRAIDLWTGMTFDPEVKFKVPTRGIKEWKGCYSCPSTAIAAIHQYSQTENLTQQEYDEIYDHFQSTVVKIDPANEYEHFTPTKAPPHQELKEWGGALTYEEYLSKFHYDIQRKIYRQRTQAVGDSEQKPEGGDEASTSAAALKAAEDPPNTWNVVYVKRKGKMGEAARVVLPRGVPKWLEFLGKYAGRDFPHAVICYIHPREKMFAIGDPKDFGGDHNRRVSVAFGRSPIYGGVSVFRKTQIKLQELQSSSKPPSKKRSMKEKEEKKEESEPDSE